MEPHSTASLQEMEEGDLAKHMRLPDSKVVVDAAQAIHDDNCFILHNEDGLVKHLSKISPDGSGRYTVRMSMSCAGAGAGAGEMAPRGYRFEIILVRGQRGDGPVAAEGAELASRTKGWLARARPGRRLRLLNLGLGVAIFAAMSATSLVAVSPPLSYVFAAGALAPAGIMLARAAGRHA